jgi:predicted nucleotidyltransferase
VTDKAHILQLIKESVSATDPKATLILYGSYARGDYDDESDIDLLILVDKEKVTLEDQKKFAYPLYDVELKVGIIISPLVHSRNLWETSKMVTPFSENVNRESIRL